MIATIPDSLTVYALEMRDFCKLEYRKIEPRGHNVRISGDNGQGKTTVIDAFRALCGDKDGREMPEPIRKGADSASVKTTLSNGLIIERIYTRKGDRQVVTKVNAIAPDGSRFKKTEEICKGLLGGTLDEFVRARPQDQIDDVLTAGGVQPPVEAVHEITGERHEPKPGESAEGYLMRLSADETGLYYSRRRELHRSFTNKQKAEHEQQQQLIGLGGPVKDGEAPRRPSEMFMEMDELQAQADSRRELGSKASDLARDVTAGQAKLNQLKNQLAEEHKAIAADQAAIRELQARLERRQLEAIALETRVAKGEEIEAQRATLATEAAKEFQAAYDPAAKMADLRTKIAQVETDNAKLSKRRAAAELLERLGTERADAEAEHERLDKMLSRLRHLRAHLLDGIDLGIKGLEVGQGELRLNGTTFRQASQAESYVVAAMVRMLRPALLKVLLIDSGESLGEEAREAVYSVARKNGYQVWFAERCKGPLQVEIEEGVAA